MLFAGTFRFSLSRLFYLLMRSFLGHTGTLEQTTAPFWLIFQLTDMPFYLGLEGFCLG